MFVRFALCQGAALRICDSCHCRTDRHPAAARTPHQPYVTPATTTRCPHWKARPAAGAVTPTDSR